MKFESGLEKKARGGVLKGLDAYKDSNSESVDELLEKRQQEQVAITQRQAERINKLKKMEDAGILFVKE